MRRLKIKKAVCFSFIDAEKEIPRALDPWYKQGYSIIAVDGLYKTPLSPAMKKKNLAHYSQDNSDHILKTRYPDRIIYEKLYGTQMEKRQRCLDIAAEEKFDYVVVWDSDEYIHPEYQNWKLFHKQIDHVLKKHKDELILRMQAYIPDDETWPKQRNVVATNSWRTYNRIHIHPDKQRYAFSHYTWTRNWVTDEMIHEWLFNTKNNWALFAECPLFIWPTGIIIDGIRIAMDRKLRSAEQLEHGDDWAWQEIHDETYRYIDRPFWHFHNKQTVGDLGEYYFDKDGVQKLHDTGITTAGTVEMPIPLNRLKDFKKTDVNKT